MSRMRAVGRGGDAGGVSAQLELCWYMRAEGEADGRRQCGAVKDMTELLVLNRKWISNWGAGVAIEQRQACNCRLGLCTAG